jgi:hypothetical protein
MNINKLKSTTHGVDCGKTKEVFKELKRRGFKTGLENGGRETYKIVSFINGKYFAISMSSSVYCKDYSRGMHKWQSFKDIDELVMASIINQGSQPTEKQLIFIEILSKQKGVADYKKPKSVLEAIELISRLKAMESANSTNDNLIRAKA